MKNIIYKKIDLFFKNYCIRIIQTITMESTNNEDCDVEQYECSDCKRHFTEEDDLGGECVNCQAWVCNDCDDKNGNGDYTKHGVFTCGICLHDSICDTCGKDKEHADYNLACKCCGCCDGEHVEGFEYQCEQ